MPCPLCGSEKNIAPDWQERKMHNYAYGDSISPAPGTKFMRSEPVASANVPNQVIVPFLVTIISGLFPAVAIGAIVATYKEPTPFNIGTIGAGISWSIAWFFSNRKYYDLLWRIEEFIGADINQDGKVGEPPQTPVEEVERYPNGTLKHWRLDWLPITPETTQQLAIKLLIDKVPFTRRDLLNTKLITFDKYGKIKKILDDRGIIYKDGIRYVLSRGGYEWFSKLLPDGMTPPPYQSLKEKR